MTRPDEKDAAIRELVLTVELLRTICEHSEGRTEADEEGLTLGMRVGIRVASKYRPMLGEGQTENYWADVKALPDKYLPNEEGK